MKSLVVIVALLIACLAFTSMIALRNYRAARTLVEASQPSLYLKNPGGANPDGLQPVILVSHGLQLAAWYIASKNRAAVVVTHGTYSDRGSMLTEMRCLSAAGFGVLAFDWPGLGESQGSVRWGAQAMDSLGAAIDWLAARPDVDPHRIGGLGFSIGGFVLTQVAAEDPRVRAVVVESAASDFDAYVDIHYSKWGFLSKWPARWALRDSELFVAGHSALARIGDISPRPVLIIGETGDPNVPESMLRTLYEAAHQPKQLWLIPGLQHGSYEQAAGAEYGQHLQKFFGDNLTATATDARSAVNLAASR